jgi:RNA polymerase sigma-70 factor (family 1)
LEKDEFNQIFDCYYDSIKNFLYYKSGNLKISEDLSQEVFIIFWEKHANIRTETIKSLLYTIAKNLFLNHYKHQKVELRFRKEYVPSHYAESPDFLMEFEEFDTIVQKAISQLSEKQRDVLLMNRIDNLSFVEISERLGISVSAVEKRMKLALASLKKVIGNGLKF